jgi:putative mRNA 3-end processing factor
VHWSKARGLKARPLAIVGYGDEDESDGTTDGVTGESPPIQP